jgi:UDP-N-acetylglucosamine--N-acetylmuramyl-(pentapeptide) pyrophosphoryl-undecaprenol N-acetylglucosamine transferase
MRVLVVTGASGGHIFPALGFIDTLKSRYNNIETLLVLPRRSLKSGILPEGCRIKYISTSTIESRINFKNLIALFMFLKGALESLFIFFVFKPEAVVGFGGLDSIPLLLIAWTFGVNTLIHEQNFIPGRANRLLARFSDRIAISFMETKDYLKVDHRKILFTGNPIRKELKKVDKGIAFNHFGFSEDKFTILVAGGSSGSHKINTCFLTAVSAMQDASGLQIIHIAGNADYQFLENGYKNLNLRVKLFSFLKDMQYAYSICDLAVCRAGASTVAELIFFQIPAIIIPYPFAYRHQLSNAKILDNNHCAIVIKDDDLDPGRLRKVIDELMNNPDKISLIHSGYNNIQKVNANELLVEAAVSLN